MDSNDQDPVISPSDSTSTQTDTGNMDVRDISQSPTRNILDEVTVDDAIIEACRDDLWRIIAQSFVLAIPMGVTCALTSNMNLGLMLKVYTVFPRPNPNPSAAIDTSQFLDPIFPPRGSSTTLRPSQAANLTRGLWYSSLGSFLFTLVSAGFIMRKLLLYIHAKASGQDSSIIRRRYSDLMKWKFLDAIGFLRLSMQTGVMFLLIGVCEFARSISHSIGWVMTNILTVIEAVFVWHLVLTWVMGLSVSKNRGRLGEVDSLFQDDEVLQTWARKELMEMDGDVVVACVRHILCVRLGRPVITLEDLADVEKLSLRGRLALVQILNDALQDETPQWEADKEVAWASWIGEAIVGVDNILRSAPYAPEFKVQAEMAGMLLVELLAQDVGIAKRVLVRLSSSLDPLVGHKIPLIKDHKVMSNVLTAGKDLADANQVNLPNLKKTIRRIVEHGRCDITSAFEEQLGGLVRALNEEEVVEASEGGG